VNQHHVAIKHIMDAGAGGVTVLSIVSQFAQVVSPILTVLLTLMSIIWLGIRFYEWAFHGVVED